VYTWRNDSIWQCYFTPRYLLSKSLLNRSLSQNPECIHLIDEQTPISKTRRMSLRLWALFSFSANSWSLATKIAQKSNICQRIHVLNLRLKQSIVKHVFFPTSEGKKRAECCLSKFYVGSIGVALQTCKRYFISCHTRPRTSAVTLAAASLIRCFKCSMFWIRTLYMICFPPPEIKIRGCHVRRAWGGGTQA
jgi:hypothetical protein